MATKTKRVDERYLKHFRDELDRWVKDENEGNQSRAAKRLGFTQGQVSAIINGTRGFGLNVLLAMRLASGKSLDELLGLGPPPAEELLARLHMAVETEVARYRRDARQTLDQARAKLVQDNDAHPHKKKKKSSAS